MTCIRVFKSQIWFKYISFDLFFSSWKAFVSWEGQPELDQKLYRNF